MLLIRMIMGYELDLDLDNGIKPLSEEDYSMNLGM